MNIEQWIDESERRVIRDNRRSVVWMTNAELDEIYEMTSLKPNPPPRNRETSITFLGYPVAVIDQPPLPFWRPPVTASRRDACKGCNQKR